jgi:hypothetical protein
MTTFNSAKLTGITVNLKSGQISISAQVELSDGNFEKAEALRKFLGTKASGVMLEIKPLQLDMLRATMPVKERKA